MPPQPHLSVERVTAERAAPARWMPVLPGIYGAGRNWGSVARRFVEARPDWGALLVDLRQHGASQGFSPPHTIAAAAGDLREALGHEGVSATAVLGHSFGGKVALLAARAGLPGLRQVWVVDSTPDARPPGGSAWDMLSVLRAHAGPFGSRGEAVEALRSAGLAPPVAQWMATNLEEEEGRYRWRLDPDAMEALLRSFFAEDAWDVVESPPAGVEVHVVKAEDSSILDEEAVRRLEAAGRTTGRVHLHRLEGGHWLNADDPEGLVALLAEHAPR